MHTSFSSLPSDCLHHCFFARVNGSEFLLLLRFDGPSKDADVFRESARKFDGRNGAQKQRGGTANFGAGMKQNSISKSNIRSFSDIITLLLDENSSTPSKAHENRSSFLSDYL